MIETPPLGRLAGLLLLLAVAAMLLGCRSPASHQSIQTQSTPAQPTGLVPAVTPLNTSDIPGVASQPQPIDLDSTATPLIVQVQSTDQQPSTSVTVATLTSAPPSIPTASPSVDPEAEPVIFTTDSLDQRCGRGDVVAFDGHTLYATPRLTDDNSNFLEQLPEGTEVDIIDCRLWTDREDLSWLAVRTAQHKLGWMLIQPDKFYVTLFPVPLDPPRALTGVPAGTTIAYVPPSQCREGPVSTESTATSIGVDLIPVVGDLKGLGEAATGCDMVTGESLGNWRWFGLLGLVGLSEVALLRHGDEAAAAARLSDDVAGSLRYSDEAAIVAARNADTASDFLRQLDEAGAVSASADMARAADRGVGFSDETVQALAKLEQPCSFFADTTVHTSIGPVAIDALRPGMRVLAYDQQRNQVDFFPVTAVMAQIDTELVALTVGQEKILTTPDHPFLTADDWRPAGELVPGDLIQAAWGPSGTVTEKEWVEESRLMFNLTVANAHTYTVGSGTWVVHNACSRILRRNLGTPSWADETTEWQAHHIIPGEFEQHPFVARASQGGWQIDAGGNGIALPKWEQDAARLNLPAHRGYHRNYSASVGGQLDQLEQRALAESWSPARARSELERLISALDSELRRSSGSRLPH